MNTGHHVFTEADGALPSSPPICGGSESSHSTTILGRGATWMDSASRNKLKGELGMKMRFVVMIAVWTCPHF
jgi:hypothetical protein